MATRIYEVIDNKDGAVRLVRAGHPARAQAHVSEGRFTVCVASQEAIVSALKGGIDVEDVAGGDDAPPAPTTAGASTSTSVFVADGTD